ncbi:MAG TPA: tRNA pseudouridine(38-40) synthase TruA, partial [Myxococcaceae bacterium]|nr:tRNA pseudouridine(38-40) synthase TruA [Myxococcaceae bacterium]
SVALWLWYRGDRFRGYQSQPRGPTVQDALESALAQLSVQGRPLPSGRTDLGVHARMQVVRVRIPEVRTLTEVVDGLRARLPEGLGVALAKKSAPRFHPQWDSAGKVYRYRIFLPPSPQAAAPPFFWRVPWDVEPERLEEVLAQCRGTRDFIAFHEKSSARKLRTVSEASLAALGEGRFEVRWAGDGFGRYQVRYLTGSAVATAAGELAQEDFARALDDAQPMAGVKAPAEGLILWEVFYPPALDPFTAIERQAALGVPQGLPWAV